MSNTEFVSVPRDLLNRYVGGDDSDWVEAGQQLRAILAQPAAQHQGEPVYQLRNTVVGKVWREADKEAYDSSADLGEYERRLLYAHAEPAEVEWLRYKAELYDEVLGLTTGLGYMNVTTAISTLRAQLAEASALLHELDDAWNSHDGKERFGRLMQKVEVLSASAEPSPDHSVEADKKGELEVAGYEGAAGLYYTKALAVANGEQKIEPIYRVKK